MNSLRKSKFIFKYKKLILFLVSVVLIIGLSIFVFYDYKQNIIENKKNIGLDLLKSGEYDEAIEKLNEYLSSVPDDNNVKEIVSIISIYNTSKDYFYTGNFELVISTLETMPEKANEYPIKSKIDELKKNTSETIKNKNIIEDYFIEKDRLEKEVEEIYIVTEEKPNNEVQSGSNSTSKQSYITYTSPAKGSSQIITVTAKGGSNGELVMWQKDSNGIWYEYDRMYAMLGSAGMKEASEVYEMDMSTPTGVYTLTEAFGVGENPGSGVPYRQLDGSEYWIDDPNSKYYNTMQFGESNGRWTSAEYLMDYKNAYKYSLVIDYNRSPVIPGKSSAIFLHVDVGIPTWGCVAVAENKMIKILNWIDQSSNPKIILGFTENYISNM